jgi:hypothetical protein
MICSPCSSVLLNHATFSQIFFKMTIVETSPEDIYLSKYGQESIPKLKKEYFSFLKEISQLEQEILQTLDELQNNFEPTTAAVVDTRHEMFNYLCSRGYSAKLATLLTKDSYEDNISYWILSQWTVEFISYATKD